MLDDKQLLLIRKYDLWANLTDEEYDELNVMHNFIVARKGDYIYFDGHFHNKLYFIKEGYIKVGYVDDNGEEIIKEIIHKGEFFGQFTLEKNNLNGEFARAYKADVSLCAFNVEDFEKLLKKKPQIAISYSKQVGHKLRNAEYRLINMLNKDVRSRLISFFYQLAMQSGYDGNADSFQMKNFLSHDDIARLIGSARQTVTSFLADLEKENLVISDRKKIHIPDVRKLQRLAAIA
jgi:CRP/FNR family transcriptional regulator, cyclic AMP receptor protein